MVNISKIVHLEWHCVLYNLIILFFLELQMLQTFCIYIETVHLFLKGT